MKPYYHSVERAGSHYYYRNYNIVPKGYYKFIDLTADMQITKYNDMGHAAHNSSNYWYNRSENSDSDIKYHPSKVSLLSNFVNYDDIDENKLNELMKICKTYKSEKQYKGFSSMVENEGIADDEINEEKIDSSYVPVFDYLSSDYKFEPVEIPEMKRPKKPDAQKVLEAESKDDSETSFSETEKIIKYGTSSEISDVINKIVENDDPRYGDILYDLFQVSKNVDIRTKILEYFTKQKDDCLAGYALEILNDPYDYPNKTVENVFRS